MDSDGTCPFKRDGNHDYLGGWVGGGIAATSICNWVGDDDNKVWKQCPRYYREAALARLKPEIFCCKPLESLFHECAEEIGYMSGGFDLRKYPNDGKDVWRNYQRIRFSYCPFCGMKLGEPFVRQQQEEAQS